MTLFAGWYRYLMYTLTTVLLDHFHLEITRVFYQILLFLCSPNDKEELKTLAPSNTGPLDLPDHGICFVV